VPEIINLIVISSSTWQLIIYQCPAWKQAQALVQGLVMLLINSWDPNCNFKEMPKLHNQVIIKTTSMILNLPPLVVQVPVIPPLDAGLAAVLLVQRTNPSPQ
jgi:hypothetical protein